MPLVSPTVRPTMVLAVAAAAIPAGIPAANPTNRPITIASAVITRVRSVNRNCCHQLVDNVIMFGVRARTLYSH
jgi:hypothetical protein